MSAVITVVRGGEVYAPAPIGTKDVVIVRDRIALVGSEISISALENSGLPCDVIDASGCIVTPGFVDPHSHLIGTAGEQGFASRTTDVPFEDLVEAGVTTVVGCLGTDDSTRHISTLLGRVRQLFRQGLTAYAYTGSFHMPPPLLTSSVRDDLILIPEFIGLGEFAIADYRDTGATAEDIAWLASQCLVGGLLGEKAGVMHFHVGPGRTRLSLLHEVLDNYEVPGRHLYPTHVMRTVELLEDAIRLVARGAYVDFDTIEPVGKWVREYMNRGGDLSKLTLSSDAHAPEGFESKLRDEVLKLVKEDGHPLERVLPLVTENTARALKLPRKGRIESGADGDVLVMEKGSLALRDVFSRGKALRLDGVTFEPVNKSFEEP